MNARRRLLVLLGGGLLVSACLDAVAPAKAATDAGAIFDQVWREYDRHYAFFASRPVDWAGVRAKYRPAALAGGPALVAALCAMIDTLQDYHAALFVGGTACGAPPLVRNYPYSPAAAIGYLDTPVAVSPSGTILYGPIGGDVAYVRLTRFADGGQAAELDRALQSLGAVRGVVIDLRGNSGGNSATGDEMAGRFADRERRYAEVRYRNGTSHDDFSDPVVRSVRPAGRQFAGNVALIVDRTVGSAGEDFTMAMRVLPSVTVVGDTTSGNASNPLWRELPNGWSFWVPQSIETTMDGITPTADGGIPPAVFARTTFADSAGDRDAMLDRAIAIVRR